MSPVSAFCFLLASLSFLSSLSRTAIRPWRSTLALGVAGVLVGTSFVFLLAYFFGSPLLYGGTFIPPALNSVLALVMLGLALMALAGWEVGRSGRLPGGGSKTAFAFALIFVLLAAAIITVGYRSYRNYERSYYSTAERQLMTIADLKVEELVQYRKERLEDASVFLNNDGFSVLVKRFLTNPEDVDAQWQIQEWADKFIAMEQYDHVRLLDVHGVTRLSSPVGLPQVTFVSQRIPQVMGSNQVTFRDLHLNEIDHRAYMNIMVPIFEEQDVRRPLGIFYLRIDPEKYLYPFIKRWPMPSETGETLLVRRDGNDVLYLNNLRYRTNAALNLRVSLEQTNVSAVKVALGQSGIVKGVDYRGVPVIAAVRAVTDSPWFLVAKLDQAEVYAPLHERLRLTILLAGLLLIGAGLGIGMFWRHQRVRFYKEQYKMAEALRESEERFGRVFEEGPTGMAMLDETFRFIQVNPAFASMLGYSGEELQKMTFPDITHPDEVQRDVEQVRRLLRGELAVYRAEKRYVARSGKELWGLVQVSVVLNSAGAFRYFLAIVSDITERKRTEAALRESQALHRSLVEQMPAGIFRKDLEGRYVLVNAWFCQLRGMKAEEILGKTPEELIAVELAKHGETRPGITRLLTEGTKHHDRIMRNGERIEVEEEYPAVNGRKRYLRVVKSPVFDPAGKIIGTQGVQFDITEIKRAEEALRESQALYYSLMEQLPVGVFRKDPAGRYVLVNPWFCRLKGMKAEEFLGKLPEEVAASEAAKQDPTGLAVKYAASGEGHHGQIMRTGKPIELVEEYTGPNGRKQFVQVMKLPVFDLAGKVIGTQGILSDITELKQAGEVLRRSHEEFKDLFDNAPVGFHEVDAEGRLVRINNTELKMLGYSAEELLGQFVWKISGEQETSRRAVLAKLGGEPPPEVFGRMFRRKDGSVFSVLISDRILKDKDGAIVGIRSAIQDDTERKRAEDALRVSEQRLHALLQTIPDLVWLKDVNGVFLFCNGTFERMIGARESAIVGKTDYDFVDKSLADFFRQRDQTAMAADGPTTNEEWLTFAEDGYCGLFQTIKTPVRGADGVVIGVLGVARDITERKRAEEELRLNQERLLRVIAQTRCILNSGQVEGPENWRERALHPESPFYWNFPVQNEEAAQKILPLELKPGEKYQQAWTRCRSHDDHTQMNWNSGNAFLNDLPFFRNEFRCTDKHGVGHWMQQFVTVRKLADNRWEVFGITMDISDLKRIETDLRESQALYHSLVNQIPAGVFRKDAKGRYVFVNSEFCRLKGITPDQYLGKMNSEIETRDVALAARGTGHHATIMQTGKPIEDDEVNPGPNGEPRNYHVLKTPVLDFAGKIIGTQGILFDNTELMQATQRVADALNFNQTVLRASPVGIVIFKASGPCVSTNEAIGQIVGGSREEVLKQNFRQLESWKNSGMLAAAEDALTAQAERSLETQITTTFGKKAWFSCRFAPFHYQGESHLLLAINDITERKRAEDTVRQSEEMLKRSQHVAKLGHYTFNVVSGDWASSDTLNDVFGIDATFKKDVAGWSKLIYPEDRNVMTAYFQDHVLKQHNPFDKEYRIVRPNDGAVRWVHGIGELRFNASGEVTEMFGTIQDITERKEVEQALRWSETQLQVILESTADGILAVDSQGKTIVANQRFAELWRIPQSVMDGKDDRVMLNYVLAQLTDPDAFLNKVQLLYGTDALDMDTLAFKDGRIYERYSFPMMMDGAVIGRVWSFRDITERKRQERLLSEKNTELERFTYTVSHDLKSPLVTVKTFLGYLEQDMAGTDKERVKQDVTYMHNAADKMGLLLDELLNLARVGRKTNPAERITFKELTREVIRLVTGRIIANGVEVKVADVDMVLEGDRPRLMEVWQNLVENACKFKGDQPKPRIDIGVEQRGAETVFFVRDNGVGIEPRFQAKVFGLFEKLDPKGEGTGMGLALVKRIVEMYNGRIWVESPGLGQGANFLFTLPGAVIIKPEQSS
jgi:PAS domain S-box-containing protein